MWLNGRKESRRDLFQGLEPAPLPLHQGRVVSDIIDFVRRDILFESGDSDHMLDFPMSLARAQSAQIARDYEWLIRPLKCDCHFEPKPVITAPQMPSNLPDTDLDTCREQILQAGKDKSPFTLGQINLLVMHYLDQATPETQSHLMMLLEALDEHRHSFLAAVEILFLMEKLGIETKPPIPRTVTSISAHFEPSTRFKDINKDASTPPAITVDWNDAFILVSAAGVFSSCLIPDSYRPVCVAPKSTSSFAFVLLVNDSKSSYLVCRVRPGRNGTAEIKTFEFAEQLERPVAFIYCLDFADSDEVCVAFQDVKDAQGFRITDGKLVATGIRYWTPFCANPEWKFTHHDGNFCVRKDEQTVNVNAQDLSSLLFLELESITEAVSACGSSSLTDLMRLCAMDVYHTCWEEASDCFLIKLDTDELNEIIAFLQYVTNGYEPKLFAFIATMLVFVSVSIHHQSEISETSLNTMQKLLEQLSDADKRLHPVIFLAMALLAPAFIQYNPQTFSAFVDKFVAAAGSSLAGSWTPLIFAFSMGICFVSDHKGYLQLLLGAFPAALVLDVFTNAMSSAFSLVTKWGEGSPQFEAVKRFWECGFDALCDLESRGIHFPRDLAPLLMSLAERSEFESLAVNTASKVLSLEIEAGSAKTVVKVGQELRPDVLAELRLFLTLMHFEARGIKAQFQEVPVTDQERDLRIVLESNVLKIDGPVSLEGSRVLLPKRSLSRGLSFGHAGPMDPHQRTLISGFLRDIVESSGKGLGDSFTNFMRTKVKDLTDRNLPDAIQKLRRLYAAVLLKHLGVAEEALDLAFAIAEGEQNMVVPGAVQFVWVSANRFMRSLRQCRQTSDSFDDISREYERKLDFLLGKEPLIRILCQGLGSGDIAGTRNDIVNEINRFLNCDSKLEDIEAILAMRARRWIYRKKVLERVCYFCENLNVVYGTVLQMELGDILEDMFAKPELGSLSKDLVEEVSGLLGRYITYAVKNVCDVDQFKFVAAASWSVLKWPFASVVVSGISRGIIEHLLSVILKHPMMRNDLLWSLVLRFAMASQSDFVDIFVRFGVQNNVPGCLSLAALFASREVNHLCPEDIDLRYSEAEKALYLAVCVVRSRCSKEHCGKYFEMIRGFVQAQLDPRLALDDTYPLFLLRFLLTSDIKFCKDFILSREYGDPQLMTLLRALSCCDIKSAGESPLNIIFDDEQVLTAIANLAKHFKNGDFGYHLTKLCCWLLLKLPETSKFRELMKDIQLDWHTSPMQDMYRDFNTTQKPMDDIWKVITLTNEGACLKTKKPCSVWVLMPSDREPLPITCFQVTFPKNVPFAEIGFVLADRYTPFQKVSVRYNGVWSLSDNAGTCVTYPITDGATYACAIKNSEFLIVELRTGQYLKIARIPKHRHSFPVIALGNAELDDIEIVVKPMALSCLRFKGWMKDHVPPLNYDIFDVFSDSLLFDDVDPYSDIDIATPPGSIIHAVECDAVVQWTCDGGEVRQQLLAPIPVVAGAQTTMCDNSYMFLKAFETRWCKKYEQRLFVLCGRELSHEVLLELTALYNPAVDIPCSYEEKIIRGRLLNTWKALEQDKQFLDFVNEYIVANAQDVSPTVANFPVTGQSFWPYAFELESENGRNDMPILRDTGIAGVLSIFERQNRGIGPSVPFRVLCHRDRLHTFNGMRILIDTLIRVNSQMLYADTIDFILSALPLLANLRHTQFIDVIVHRTDIKNPIFGLLNLLKSLPPERQYSMIVKLDLRSQTKQALVAATDALGIVSSLSAVLLAVFVLGKFSSFEESAAYWHDCIPPPRAPLLKRIGNDLWQAVFLSQPELCSALLSSRGFSPDEVSFLEVFFGEARSKASDALMKIHDITKGHQSVDVKQFISRHAVYAGRSLRIRLLFNIQGGRQFPLEIDKMAALEGRETLLHQLMRQIPRDQIPKLGGNVPWHVEYRGEVGVDAGGLRRDFLMRLCQEVQSPGCGLFTKSPNGRNKEGPNQNLLIPSDSAGADEMFYVGFLIGVCLSSHLPQDFKFANLIWSYLVSGAVEDKDIGDIDQLAKQFLNSQYVPDPSTMVDIWGKSIVSQSMDRDDIRAVLIDSQKRKLDLVLKPLREGLVTYLRCDNLFFLRPRELELETCGPDVCPIGRFRNIVKIDREDQRKLMYEAFEMLSDSERLAFVAFATGCQRLPPIGSGSEPSVNIAVERNREGLPIASVCFSTVRCHPYSSVDQFLADIRLVLEWGGDFGLA